METDVKMKVSSYSALSTYCFVQANRKLQTRLQRWKLFFFSTNLSSPHKFWSVSSLWVCNLWLVQWAGLRNLRRDLRQYLKAVRDHEKPISSRCFEKRKEKENQIYPDLNLWPSVLKLHRE